MKSLNVIYLLGNVGKDAEVKALNGQNGTIKVANFTLATSEGGYQRQDGTQVEERTQWHNVTAWRNLAEVAEKYIKKGDKVLVTGHVEYRTVENQDGTKRTFTDIIADDLNLLSPKQQAEQPLVQQGAPQYAQQYQQPMPQPQAPQYPQYAQPQFAQPMAQPMPQPFPQYAQTQFTQPMGQPQPIFPQSNDDRPF